MDPVSVIAAIGALADTVGKVKSLFGKKPKPVDAVAQLTPYLKEIINQLEVIRSLNVAILNMVSQLPEVIRVVVRDELLSFRLQSAYDTMKFLNTRFEAMGEEAKFDIVTSATFDKLWEALSIIFDQEPRVGALGPMLAQMEFADIATKRQESIRRGFRFMLSERANRLVIARKIQEDAFMKEAKILSSLLASVFIAESNSNTVTSSFDLTFSGLPDRQKTETYYVSRTVPVDDGISCCRQRMKVIQEPHERQVLDTEFAAQRDKAVADVQQSKKRLNDIERVISALKDDIDTLDWYSSDMLSQGDNFVEVESFLFIPADHEQPLLDVPFLPRAPNCYSV